MARVINLEDGPRFGKVIGYGLPGSGKTSTFGSAAMDPRTSPCLWLDFAGNPESLSIFSKKPFIVQVEQLSDINDWYEYLKLGQQDTHKIVKQYQLTNPFKSIVLDGGTEVSRMAKDKYSEEKDKLDVIPKKFEHDDHGAILRYMLKFARLFLKQDLQIHTFLTLLERRIKKPSGVEISRPGLTGQAIEELPGYALAMGQIMSKTRAGAEAGKAQYSVMFLEPSPKRDAKWQYGKNPIRIEDPTVTKIMDLIESK